MQLEGDSSPLEVPTVPATSLSALVKAGKVPDPFIGRNEALVEVQEVGEKAVTFSLTFDNTLAKVGWSLPTQHAC